MAATHCSTIRTPYPVSQTQIACNGTYISMPFTKSSIGIWSLQNINSKPLELVAHKSQVSAISFGNLPQPTTHICTAGTDYIIVWNVEKARATYDTGHQIRGTIIGTNYERPEYVSFDPDDRSVAVCVENDVFILDAREERLDTTLEGHTALVTCAKFCPHDPDVVVSASEDRTFKVWNIASQSLIYQSSIVSSSPFLCLDIDPFNQSVALGTTDGQLRVFDLSEGKGFRCLHHIDVARNLRERERSKAESVANAEQGPKTISSKQSWHNLVAEGAERLLADGDEEDGNLVEYGESILSLAYFHPKGMLQQRSESAKDRDKHQNVPAFLMPESSIAEELNDRSSRIIVGTPGALLQLNAASRVIEQHVDFMEPVRSEEHFDEETKEIGAVGGYSISSDSHKSQVTCVVGSNFQNAVNILNVKCNLDSPVPSRESEGLDGKVSQNMDKSTDNSQVDGGSAKAVISVISETPLLEKSLLRSELTPKTGKPNTAATKKKTTVAAGKSSKGIKDQPLTFKSKVKSSGYTQTARTKMFSPNTRPESGKKRESKSSVAATTAGIRSMMKEYPMDSEPPQNMKTKLAVSKQGSPINAIKFTDDGQTLACAMADRSAQLFKMPLTGKGTAFSGHNGAVTDVSWSHDNQWILTASSDQTARVWTRGMADPVMTFDHVNHNFGSEDKDNVLYGKEINRAQFYYVDRFVLLLSSSLFMYKYYLDTKVDDIKRYQTNSRYKLVKHFQPSKAQSITAMSAINTFNSYIVMCAGSDKSVEVFDMNVGKSAAHIPDVHSRQVHAIAQNQGSMYASHASGNYDLFATAAVTDGIKVWDLRSQKCVKHLEGHLNRAHRCGLCFSPCGRFIATGAEDRSAYVYDLRGGTYVRKFTGHTDVVTDVSYHPLYPELVTASLNGELRLYSDR